MQARLQGAGQVLRRAASCLWSALPADAPPSSFLVLYADAAAKVASSGTKPVVAWVRSFAYGGGEDWRLMWLVLPELAALDVVPSGSASSQAGSG